MSVASDLKAGVAVQWTANGILAAAIPLAKVYSGSVPGTPAPPYASYETTPLGDEFSGPVVTGEKYLSKHRLTIRVWASGDDAEGAVGPLVPKVQAVFGVEGWAVPNSTLVASFLGEIVQVEDGEYGGNQVWRADVPFEVWLQRIHP